jgi:hypothetical protein
MKTNLPLFLIILLFCVPIQAKTAEPYAIEPLVISTFIPNGPRFPVNRAAPDVYLFTHTRGTGARINPNVIGTIGLFAINTPVQFAVYTVAPVFIWKNLKPVL